MQLLVNGSAAMKTHSRFPTRSFARACFALLALHAVSACSGFAPCVLAQSTPLPDGKIELSAARLAPSSNAVSRQDGNTPVIFLNASTYEKNKNEGGYGEWTLETPLPAGWWHGVAASTLRYEQYANREIGFAFIAGQSKTTIPFAPHNYRGGKKGDTETFEFWIYLPTPFSTVRYVPTTDLYRWNDTWPLAKLTLEHKDPDNLTAGDAISLKVPVQDGVAQLPPQSLPPGSYWMSGVNQKNGKAMVMTQDGKSVTLPYTPDQYGRPLPQTRPQVPQLLLSVQKSLIPLNSQY